jgi:hypothetical protein
MHMSLGNRVAFSAVLVAVFLALLPTSAPIVTVQEVPGVGRGEVWVRLRAMGAWHEWTDTFRVGLEASDKPPEERRVTPGVGKLLSVKTFWRNRGLGAVLPASVSPERLIRADDEAFALCWRVEMLPAKLLDTDRCVDLRESTSYGTQIVNRIQFLGLLGPVVNAIMGAPVRANFEAFNAHLAAAASGMAPLAD